MRLQQRVAGAEQRRPTMAAHLQAVHQTSRLSCTVPWLSRTAYVTQAPLKGTAWLPNKKKAGACKYFVRLMN